MTPFQTTLTPTAAFRGDPACHRTPTSNLVQPTGKMDIVQAASRGAEKPVISTCGGACCIQPMVRAAQAL